MTVAVIVELIVKPEFIEDVAQGFAETFVATRAFEGCLSIHACRDPDHPNRIVTIEHWREPQDYDRYMAWRASTGMMEQIAAVAAEPPIYRILPVFA